MSMSTLRWAMDYLDTIKATSAKKAAAGKARTKANKPKNQSGGFSKVYQFKITLLGAKPRIWRRIQVPENYTFYSLHEAIQDAMGWEDYHLHQFDLDDGTKIDMLLDDEVWDEEKIYDHDAIISDYFCEENMVAMYEYDFGDLWKHKVLFENVVQADPKQVYPRCLGGRRACPPEDAGGTYGYKHLLKVMKTPPKYRDEDMKELMDWLKRYRPGYNPDFFDAERVNFRDIRSGFRKVNLRVYQFKITLLGAKPRIWRRIQVPENYTFYSLHEAIQDAMGWEDYHLHQFDLDDGTKIDMLLDDEVWDEEKIYDHDEIISDYFYEENMVAMYEYDFGDSWEHKVVFEKAVKADPKQVYPRCIDGRRACPPEDAGGTYGYKRLLKVMKTPPESRDDEKKELMEWLEDMRPGYDPDFFDAQHVNFRDSRIGGR